MLRSLLCGQILNKHWIIKSFGSTFSINAHVPGRNVGVCRWEKWLFGLIEDVKVSLQTVASGQVDRRRKYGRGIKKQKHNRGCVCTPVGWSAVSHASTDWFHFKSALWRGRQGHSSTSQTLAVLLQGWMFICSNQSLQEPKQFKGLTLQQANASESGYSGVRHELSFLLRPTGLLLCRLDSDSSAPSVNLLPLLDTKEKISKDASICTECRQLLKVKL